MTNHSNFHLTPEQRDEFKSRLDYLTNVALPANAIAIKDATALGDLSENAEYSSAKEEHAKLNNEKQKIQNILNNAIIIKKSNNTDSIELGHFVTIKWADSNIVETIQLLGYGDGEKNISSDSPLGKALLNRKIGENVTFTAPKKPFTVTILEIK